MSVPRKLSVSKLSPSYNEEALKMVDRVYVNGESPGLCQAYDMDAGWAIFKRADRTLTGKIYGIVAVTKR